MDAAQISAINNAAYWASQQDADAMCVGSGCEAGSIIAAILIAACALGLIFYIFRGL